MDKYRLKPDDCILIVIDIQDKLMQAMEHRDKVYKNHDILLTLCKVFNIPVIQSEQYPRGLGSTVAEIKLMLPEEYHSITKTDFSACTVDLHSILEKLGRKTVLITGTETHVCVFQTTRDLLQQGYTVHVIRDAVCSRFKENYLSGLELMKDMGAVINNTETVAFDMLKCAGTPEFKTVSAVIK